MRLISVKNSNIGGEREGGKGGGGMKGVRG